MKLHLILALAALYTAPAHAYSSAPAGDPVLGFRDVETKTAVLATATGYNDAVTKGMGLFYEDGTGDLTGLYKVSTNYSGTYNTAAASVVTACIAARNVATADNSAEFPCVTKGYVDYALYTVATGNAIAIGTYLCVDDLSTAHGKLVGCGSGITSPFVSLEAKAENTSGTIKVRVNSQ